LMPIYQKPNTSKAAKGHKTYPYLQRGLRVDRPVIPPFLRGLGRRIYAAILSFCAGVIPPLPMLGRSLL